MASYLAPTSYTRTAGAAARQYGVRRNPNETYTVGGVQITPGQGVPYPTSPTNPPYVAPWAQTPPPVPPVQPTTPQTQTPGPESSTVAGNPPQADYSSDPILQQIIAGGQTDITAANARLLEGQKQALLALGSRSLGESVLGKNDPFLGLISDDPYKSMSQLAQIGRQYSYDQNLMGQGWQLREDLNKNNLFYSGARALQETALGRERQAAEFGAQQMTQQQLASLRDAWSQAMGDVRNRRIAGEQDAYQRWLDSLMNAGGGGGEGGTTTGTDTTPTGALPAGGDYGGYVPGSYTGYDPVTGEVSQPFTGDLSSPQGYIIGPDGQPMPLPPGWIPRGYQMGMA